MKRKIQPACNNASSSSGCPRRARFPVIDLHNHAWAGFQAGRVARTMDLTGVKLYCNLTGNMKIVWSKGGYEWRETPFNAVLSRTAPQIAQRFFSFTTATFARPANRTLFTDARLFMRETLAMLRDHVAQGAYGLKILKELGLHYRDGRGKLIFCDDARLAPLWEECARLGVPVLIHQADPTGFFQPLQPSNPHFSTLKKYPAWSFADRSRFPGFATLQRHCRNLVKRHPETVFILPHMANWPENLDYVGELLDEYSNVILDFSARIDDLGGSPETTRDFFIRYQDRILFGTDMPPSAAMYRCYFRFLETFDTDFIPPDYDGTFGRYRRRICGIGLPDGVLRKIYHENTLKLLPKLKKRG